METSDLWSGLEKQLGAHAPDLAARLRPGVHLDEIESFEAELGQRLPTDVREAYLRHDGCEFEWDRRILGLFGRCQWWPLQKLRESWLDRMQWFEHDDPYFYEEEEWAGLPIRPWQSTPPLWLTLGCKIEDTVFIHVDLMPGPAGVPGQLVAEGIHAMWKSIWSYSLASYLQYLSDGLASGEIRAGVEPQLETSLWVRRDGHEFDPPGSQRVFG